MFSNPIRTIVLALCLGLCLASGWAVEARAQDWGRLMTPSQPLNVRQGRTPSSKKVTTIKPGQVVRVDFLKNEWYAIFEPNEPQRDEAKALGYSKAEYLEPVRLAAWGDIRVVEPKMLNVRQGRGPDFEHVRTLYAGDMVKIDFDQDGWVAVFEVDALERDESKAIGFANEKFLPKPTDAQLATLSDKRPEPIALQPTGGTGWGRLVTLTSNVKVRQAPDPGGDIVAVMVRGDTVKIYGRNGDWLLAFLPQEQDFDPSAALGWVNRDRLGLTTADMAGQPSVAGPGFRAGDQETAVSEPTAETTPEPTPEPMPEPTPEPAPEPTAIPEPTPEPETAAETFAAAPKEEEREEHVIVVPETVPPNAVRGPEPPVADLEAHGFRYAMLSVGGQDPLVKAMEIRIYLDVNVVPNSDALRDFAATIWKREGEPSKQGVVLIYLPGQDLNGLSYGQGRFSPRGQGEFWTRETTLYGTRFK